MTENTGATITLGNASGSVVNANGIQIVSYRGEENFWGNIWWWIDGINHYADVYKRQGWMCSQEQVLNDFSKKFRVQTIC